MPKLYERVRTLRPIYLELSGFLVAAGAEATVVDLIDDNTVMIEIEEPHLVDDTPDARVTSADIYDLAPA